MGCYVVEVVDADPYDLRWPRSYTQHADIAVKTASEYIAKTERALGAAAQLRIYNPDGELLTLEELRTHVYLGIG